MSTLLEIRSLKAHVNVPGMSRALVSDALPFSALDPLIYRHDMWVAACPCVLLLTALTAKPWLNPIYCALM